MSATPANCQGKRIVALSVGLAALLSSASPLSAAGENVILEAKKAVQALETVQWAKDKFIEDLEESPPPDEGPLSDAEKRANAIHFFKTNLKVEREKLAELKVLYEKLIDSYTSVDHQADPTIRSLKRVNKIRREIDSTISDLAEPQDTTERLMCNWDPNHISKNTERTREVLRDVARDVSRRAAQEVARNAARHMGKEAARQGARPEGHHHGPGGY